MNWRVALWSQVNFPRHPVSTMRPDPGGGESPSRSRPRGVESSWLKLAVGTPAGTARPLPRQAAVQLRLWCGRGPRGVGSAHLLLKIFSRTMSRTAPHACKVTTDGGPDIFIVDTLTLFCGPTLYSNTSRHSYDARTHTSTRDTHRGRHTHAHTHSVTRGAPRSSTSLRAQNALGRPASYARCRGHWNALD